MNSSRTPEPFDRLLERLDPDRTRAGRRYEELRRTLLRFFQWRGAPFPEEHTDDTFDRVARRLAEGVVVADIGAYVYEVARLVSLEALKARAVRAADAGSAAVEGAAAVATTVAEEAARKEARLACLESCLDGLPQAQRSFILEYYRDDRRRRIDGRRLLAERLGLRREAVANRAQRLRDRLEECVRRCLGRESAI